MLKRSGSLFAELKRRNVYKVAVAYAVVGWLHTGATAEAVAILRRQLSVSAGHVSIARLKIDPVWDPIRNDPGFQELLAGKELVGAGR